MEGEMAEKAKSGAKRCHRKVFTAKSSSIRCDSFYRKPMSRKVASIVLLFCTIASTAAAQDPAERAYHVPALNPKHKDKPKLTGWAEKRVEEKLNRGLVALANTQGKVYLSWRLLKTDPPATAFNIYRSVEDGNPMKLNTRPVTATSGKTSRARKSRRE